MSSPHSPLQWSLSSPSPTPPPARSRRKRITKACDQCARHRVRCDGGETCARCIIYHLSCSYHRPRQRRGRKPAVVHRERGANPTSAPEQTAASDVNITIPSPSLIQRPRTSSATSVSQTLSTHNALSASQHQATRSSDPNPSNLSCRYPCLLPLLHHLNGIIDVDTGCSLFDHYFAQPGISLFHSASPYVLDPILRKASLQRRQRPRMLSPALTAAILWICAQTAPVSMLLRTRKRKYVCDRLQTLVMSYFSTQAAPVGHGHSSMFLLPQSDLTSVLNLDSEPQIRACVERNDCEPPSVDDILACILIAIIISGSDAKCKTLSWYHSAVHLAMSAELHLTDAGEGMAAMAAAVLDPSAELLEQMERQEETRRVFWLLYSIDRHWALSYNSMPLILDQECKVFLPLPNALWFSEPDFCPSHQSGVLGPQPTITGPGYFEFFLPLMTILGDIIWIHHQQTHPRLFRCINNDVIANIEDLLVRCMGDIDALHNDDYGHTSPRPSGPMGTTYVSHNPSDIRESTGFVDCPWPTSSQMYYEPDNTGQGWGRITATKLYAKFVVHVLFVLLHGRWDALDLLSRIDSANSLTGPTESFCSPVRSSLSDWITSEHFTKCSTNAIAASEILSEILFVDPELALVPYLFGIYLLHGSFILLLFADRMLDVGEGTNASVEKACETVIRAHEASFATLSVEYQRDFRKILRETLYNVRGHHKNRGREHSAIDHSGSWRQPHLRKPQPTLTQEQAIPGYGIGRTGVDNGTNSTYDTFSTALEPRPWIEMLSLYRWTPGSQGLAI